jgi:hypothetical protein
MLTINNNVSVIRDIKQNILYSTQNGQLVPKEATNMTMYITTDTQEIFFGNELKEFVLYSGENDLTAAEIDTLVKTLVKFDVDDLRFQLTVLSDQNKELLGYTVYDTNTGTTPVSYVPSLEERLVGYTDPVNPNTQTQESKDGLIRTEIIDYITGETDIIEDITTNVSSTILDEYYNKTEIDAEVDRLENSANISYTNTVLPSESRLTSTKVQGAIDELKTLADTKAGLQYVSNNFTEQIEHDELSEKVDLFATVEDAGTFASALVLKYAILGIQSYNEPTFDHDGIYRIKIGDQNRYELLLVNNTDEESWNNRHYTRFTYEGKTWKLLIDTSNLPSSLNNSGWIEVNPAGVSSVNEEDPDPTTGDVYLTADSIPETATRKWNNLLPQSGTRAGSAFTSAINPEGRTTGDVVGNNSIAFGNGSAATVASSIALGNTAKATAENAAQIGIGTNNTANSLQFMDKHVVIGNQVPGEIKLFGTAVIDIPLSGWEVSTKTYIATLVGVTSDAIIWIGPNEDTFADYIESEIRAVAQGNGTITFKCTDLPTRVPGNVKVNVTWRLTSGTALLP